VLQAWIDVILFGKEGTAKMRKKEGYVLAAALGAIGGGAIVAIATKAIPRMMSGMMRNMMVRMAEGGCNPADI
jgi:hypothetical protein